MSEIYSYENQGKANDRNKLKRKKNSSSSSNSSDSSDNGVITTEGIMSVITSGISKLMTKDDDESDDDFTNFKISTC